MSSPEETSAGPVIRDLRRIDPATGQVRSPGRAGSAEPGGGPGGAGRPGKPGRHAASKPGAGAAGTPGGQRGAPAPSAPGGEPPEGGKPGPEQAPGGTAGGEQELAGLLAERTADLQRVSAEFANYRKRVERDRLAVREQALSNVLSALLPVLDDIGRAREHGELVGGFKSVAESLEAIMVKLGLAGFGEEGEPFDPKVHDALAHSYSATVTEPTCVKILQPGYKVGERILRPAMVAVAEPGEPAQHDGPAEAGGSAEDDGPATTAGPTPQAGPGPANPGHSGPAGSAGPAGSQESRQDED